MSPRVSIGMPVYNGANYIRSAVMSILNQDYSDLELIISDNASDDETHGICRDLANQDERIRYYRNDVNIGAAGNYNKVFRLSRGEFFKWAAHDDECYPAMLGRCVQFLERAPSSVAMVYPLGELIDQEGRSLQAPLDRIQCKNSPPHRRLAELLWSLNMCDPVFGLIKAEYLRKTQLIGPFFGADYVLLGELAMLGEIWELGEVLFRLRAHTQRSMKANRSARARAAWYDPSFRGLFVLPNWERMIWEFAKSAHHSHLSVEEKVKCLAIIFGVHYWRRFKNAGGRAKLQVRALLGVSRNAVIAGNE